MNPYSKWIGLVLVWVISGTATADLPTDPAEYREWETKMLESIASKKERVDEEAFLKLAKYIYQLSLPYNLEREGRPVFNAAREALVAFPDHSAHLERLLERALEAEFSEARHQPRVSSPFNQHELFVVIGELRTSSCVGLLGKLLDDDREPWKNEPKTDGSRPWSNAVYATSALGKFEIEGVPVIPIKSDRDFEAARNQWKLWFAQVKAGTRTFRFKGDPKEYNLQGPVSGELPRTGEAK